MLTLQDSLDHEHLNLQLNKQALEASKTAQRLLALKKSNIEPNKQLNRLTQARRAPVMKYRTVYVMIITAISLWLATEIAVAAVRVVTGGGGLSSLFY